MKGIIAFVTNGSFIDGNAEAGLRACLTDEFSHLYVFNLRGNQRTQGERSRQEGGKIFGSGSRTPVAIMILVRDSTRTEECQIHYKDIGDYLSQEEKLQIIKESGSVAISSDWQRIVPDEHHDWLDQRDPAYQRFLPLAIKSQKFQADVAAAFSLLSLGIVTSRDPWIYNFDYAQLQRNIRTMSTSYKQRRQAVLAGDKTVEQAGRNDAPKQIKWTRGLRYRLCRNEILELKQSDFRQSMYRPFYKQHVYFNSQFIEVVYRIPYMFPTPETKNQIIGVTGRGAGGGFYALMTEVIPDLNLLEAGAQCFSRWRYEAHDPNSSDAWLHTNDEDLEDVPGYRRIDNITDWCLNQFRQQYAALQIAKDDIWHYIYGILHAPTTGRSTAPTCPKTCPASPSRRTSARFEMPVSIWRPCTWAMKPARSMSCRWRSPLLQSPINWAPKPCSGAAPARSQTGRYCALRRPSRCAASPMQHISTWSTGARRSNGQWIGYTSARTSPAASSTTLTLGSSKTQLNWWLTSNV